MPCPQEKWIDVARIAFVHAFIQLMSIEQLLCQRCVCVRVCFVGFGAGQKMKQLCPVHYAPATILIH